MTQLQITCVKMEKNKETPSAEELLRKIQDLQERHALLKQEISKLKFSGDRLAPSSSFRPVNTETNGGATEPFAMKLTETQYLNILQSMDQALHIFDHDGRIMYWNRYSEILYGFTPSEAYGKTPTELLVEPKDAFIADALVKRTASGESWSGEFPIKNKRGERFLVICMNTPFRDENRRPIGGMCISSDARPYRAVRIGPSVSAPKTIGSAILELDPQQPLQTKIASKISNLASKVKSKMKTVENYIDHEGALDQEGTSTPRGHIASSRFGIFSSPVAQERFTEMPMTDSCDDTENKPTYHKILSSKAEAWMGKKRISWPWKPNERDEESFYSRVSRFGWHRVDLDQEHKTGPQTSTSASAEVEIQQCKNTSNKIEASGLWFSSFNVSGTSTTSSTSSGNTIKSNAIIKVDKSNAIIKVDKDSLDYEILWEDLIIREQIGQGSCGAVYHGLWYGSDVAVKVFAYQEYSDDVIISFRQEVSLMKRLRHPNILLFMGAVTSPQHLCIVTEFLPRGSLFRILQRNTTRLDWRRCLYMAMDIARGMNYLHHCNPPIIHRDLKSSNLLVGKNWTVKVGDFGLSRIKHETYLKTKTGKGTPQWMAPEILRNEQADEKSDVYSYGVVLWEITTEKIPWDNLNPMQVIGAVGFMNQRLEIPKDVDPLWASLIESCWCSEPQSRPTFQEILYKLKDLQKKFAVELQASRRR